MRQDPQLNDKLMNYDIWTIFAATTFVLVRIAFGSCRLKDFHNTGMSLVWFITVPKQFGVVSRVMNHNTVPTKIWPQRAIYIFSP